eukprot:gnl/Dysnectes_brevis/4050_a5300_967.p1 GENE.gnl/Dysnectes_brevis/4050_a5300_967~~gnl/Dysnectes_brevis/4050_a5300_967.p1  ORF type:complete len:457 (+),score=51.17 gnl/Dysnectes_brevis/4050_a5300_967:88-1458(+)
MSSLNDKLLRLMSSTTDEDIYAACLDITSENLPYLITSSRLSEDQKIVFRSGLMTIPKLNQVLSAPLTSHTSILLFSLLYRVIHIDELTPHFPPRSQMWLLTKLVTLIPENHHESLIMLARLISFSIGWDIPSEYYEMIRTQLHRAIDLFGSDDEFGVAASAAMINVMFFMAGSHPLFNEDPDWMFLNTLAIIQRGVDLDIQPFKSCSSAMGRRGLSSALPRLSFNITTSLSTNRIFMQPQKVLRAIQEMCTPHTLAGVAKSRIYDLQTLDKVPHPSDGEDVAEIIISRFKKSELFLHHLMGDRGTTYEGLARVAECAMGISGPLEQTQWPEGTSIPSDHLTAERVGGLIESMSARLNASVDTSTGEDGMVVVGDLFLQTLGLLIMYPMRITEQMETGLLRAQALCGTLGTRSLLVMVARGCRQGSEYDGLVPHVPRLLPYEEEESSEEEDESIDL